MVGNPSCNQFTGAYVLSGGNLTFSKLASTQKMCPSVLMEQEMRFLAAPQQVAKVLFEKGLLVILDSKTVYSIQCNRKY